MTTADPMLPSPIKWTGGKSRLRAEVIARIPADAECYAEVFSGAAWVLFGKPPHPVEVINDADKELVNLWRVMKWRSAELLERVHQSLYSRAEFMEMRVAPPTCEDEIERAAWMYLVIQQAFGAEVSRSQNGNRGSFGFRNKSRGDLFLNSSLKRFGLAKERLRGVFVECSDFETLIKRYDQPRTIFFCDPPYLGTCGYSERFTLCDHERLAETLSKSKGRFLVTINDDPAVRAMYAGYRIEEADESRAKARLSSGRIAAPILFISNYDSHFCDAPGQIQMFGDSE